MELIASLEVIKKNFITIAGLESSDLALLQQHYGVTQRWGADITNAFYERLMANQETARVFVPGEMQARHETLAVWYASVAGGAVDEQFWMVQYRVGLVHIKRGVKNEFMTSMMNFVQQKFQERAVAEFEPAVALRLSSSFNKVCDAIQTVISEGYRLGYLEAIISTAGLSMELLDNIVKNTIDELLREHAGFGKK